MTAMELYSHQAKHQFAKVLLKLLAIRDKQASCNGVEREQSGVCHLCLALE